MGLDTYFNKHKILEIGYFKEVNFLVRFFEENCGFNADYQVPLQIEKENIIELKDRCEKVLNDNSLAEELLPTCSGLFFGDTDYNENYFSNVKEILSFCKKLIPQFDELADDEYIEFSTWY